MKFFRPNSFLPKGACALGCFYVAFLLVLKHTPEMVLFVDLSRPPPPTLNSLVKDRFNTRLVSPEQRILGVHTGRLGIPTYWSEEVGQMSFEYRSHTWITYVGGCSVQEGLFSCGVEFTDMCRKGGVQEMMLR